MNVAWMGETIQKNYGDLSIEIPHALGVGAGLQQGMIVSAALLNSVPHAAKIVLKVSPVERERERGREGKERADK